jgi:hypothetical protein
MKISFNYENPDLYKTYAEKPASTHEQYITGIVDGVNENGKVLVKVVVDKDRNDNPKPIIVDFDKMYNIKVINRGGKPRKNKKT